MLSASILKTILEFRTWITNHYIYLTFSIFIVSLKLSFFQGPQFRIYIIEQDDKNKFNRGKLLNIGAV